MATLPTPSEVRANEREQELMKDDAFVALYSKLPMREQRLAMLWLTRPDLNKLQKFELAYGRLPEGKNVDKYYKKLSGKFGAALLQFGVTEEDVANAIRGALTATKCIPYKNKDGKLELLEVPDHAVRLKTAEVIAKLGGYFPAAEVKGKIEHTHAVKPIHQQIAAKTKEEIIQLKKMREQGVEIAAEFEVVADSATN